MSTEVRSAEHCPLCLLQNKQMNPLINRPGQFYTTCGGNPQHKFEDTDELNMLRHQARGKYPNLYTPPTPPTPTDPAVFAAQDIVITAEVKKTIEEIAGMTFTGGADLKGFIIAAVQDNKDKDEELKNLRVNMSRNGGAGRTVAGGGLRPISLGPDQMIVTIPEWAIEGGIASQAEHEGITPEAWVQQNVETWLEQYFTTAAPGRARG